MQVLHYRKREMVPLLIMLQPRLPQEDLYISPESYKYRKEAAIERLDHMADYALSMDRCRSTIIQKYFGETKLVECGICDVCRGTRANLDSQILELLESQDLDIKEIVRQIAKDADSVVATIEKLLDRGEIVSLKDGKIRKKG